jgi:anti-sigma-K factor RskA
MSDEHVVDLLPAYALGALDDADLLVTAQHLSHCAACRHEMDAYLETVGALTRSVMPQNPPDDLKSRVLSRFENANQPSVRAIPPQPAQTNIGDTFRRLFGGRTGLVFGALAVVLILALAGSVFALNRQVRALQANLPPAGTMKLVQLAGTVNAPQAVGYMIVFPNENYGALVVKNAPALDSGHQYQVWLVKDGQRTSGGLFSVDSDGYGTLQINASRPLGEFQSFGITREPLGGSPGPTGPKVLGGG